MQENASRMFFCLPLDSSWVGTILQSRGCEERVHPRPMEILEVRPGWSAHHCMEEYEAKRKPSEPLAPREMESRVCSREH